MLFTTILAIYILIGVVVSIMCYDEIEEYHNPLGERISICILTVLLWPIILAGIIID